VPAGDPPVPRRAGLARRHGPRSRHVRASDPVRDTALRGRLSGTTRSASGAPWTGFACSSRSTTASGTTSRLRCPCCVGIACLRCSSCVHGMRRPADTSGSAICARWNGTFQATAFCSGETSWRCRAHSVHTPCSGCGERLLALTPHPGGHVCGDSIRNCRDSRTS
jgi:hypothetical protein